MKTRKIAACRRRCAIASYGPFLEGQGSQPTPHRQNPIDRNWNHFYRSPLWLSIYAQKAKPLRSGDRLLAEHSLAAHRTHAHLAWPAISLYIAGCCPCTFARVCALLLRALLMTTLEESPQHAFAPL